MAATSTSSDLISGEGPVLTVITKRIRALRKKLNRIIQMEDSLSNGKTLNNEQLLVLRSKPSLLVLIDELEKLRAPLSSAVADELSLVKSSPENLPEKSPESSSPVAGIEDLLKLMYFGSLFDVKPQSEFTSLMLTRTHERGCCLTYDYVTDDATDLLGERDLDLISALQGLMVSRPVNSSLSHRDALEKCIEHAKQWLSNANQPIDSQSNVTYAGLREKLKKIMASDYFTAMPQMKGPGEVAAAAAVADFGSFQVPMHESIIPVEVPVQVEGSAVQYQESENATNYKEYGTGENHSGTVEEFQKDDLELENPPEEVSVHRDQEQSHPLEEEGYQNNSDLKEQQYVHRRGQRGGRGGGRRGYPNGRGGRGGSRGGGPPYQNGRGGQYSDNYYPRNYYGNRRGGNRGDRKSVV